MLLFISKRKPFPAVVSLFTAHRIALPLTRRCSSSPPQNPPSNFTVADYLISSFGFSADKSVRLSKPLFSLPLPRHCSSSPPQNPHPDFTVVDYLISSFGFSADNAARVSKPLAHLKTPQNPDSVRRFLHQQGFSHADIIKLVTRHPAILCSSPDKTLAPNLTALRDIGLSTAALTQLVLTNPAAIMFCSAASTVKFWLNFFGDDEEALVRAFRRNLGIISHDISRVIAPNISVLRNHGLSTHEIRMVVFHAPRFISTGPALLEDTLIRAEELGFRPGSNKFAQGLQAMYANSRERLRKKMELFERFKWSEDEFCAALQKAPLWTTLSEKTLQDKMEFFVREARCDPSYIAAYPMLLTYSLEKRLWPRLRVLRLLESKGLGDEKKGFYNKICRSDKKFVESYLSLHKEEISELLEAYRAATAS